MLHDPFVAWWLTGLKHGLGSLLLSYPCRENSLSVQEWIMLAMLQATPFTGRQPLLGVIVLPTIFVRLHLLDPPNDRRVTPPLPPGGSAHPAELELELMNK